MIDARTRRLVLKRAGFRCEYCLRHQDDSPFASLHLEHIVPRKHGGSDDVHNLAVACIDCNLRKGPNLTGIDPDNGVITPLFHPRRQRWRAHFAWRDLEIIGLTPVGRATIQVLMLNSSDRIEVRLWALNPPG